MWEANSFCALHCMPPTHAQTYLSLECQLPVYACRAILPLSEPSLPPYGYQGWHSMHHVTFLAGVRAIFPVFTFSVINLKAIRRTTLPLKKKKYNSWGGVKWIMEFPSFRHSTWGGLEWEPNDIMVRIAETVVWPVVEMLYESHHAIATHSDWKCQAKSKRINFGKFQNLHYFADPGRSSRSELELLYLDFCTDSGCDECT